MRGSGRREKLAAWVGGARRRAAAKAAGWVNGAVLDHDALPAPPPTTPAAKQKRRLGGGNTRHERLRVPLPPAQRGIAGRQKAGGGGWRRLQASPAGLRADLWGDCGGMGRASARPAGGFVGGFIRFSA